LTSPRRCLAVFIGVYTAALSLHAQSATSSSGQPQQSPSESPSTSGVMVATASRRLEQLINAPATMSVISEEAIRQSAVQSVPELLRSVPGMNVAQLSARDINVESRAPSGTLTDSLLVLMDGRSVYQDFFGSVMWDLLPIDVDEIRQIEVIRGPASAVWGANAMTGVVNVISKTPREPASSITTSCRFTRPASTMGFRG
jgi:outer membrane receptor for ferrienterochelin and colicin